MLKRIYLTALVWVTALGCSASIYASGSGPDVDFILGDYPKVHDVGAYIEYFEDKSASITLNDAINLKHASSFRRTTGLSPSFTSTDSAYWFRFSAINRTTDQKTWYVRINYPSLDDIQFHVIRSDDVATINTGDGYPFSSRPVGHQYYIFPVDFKPMETVEVYIRVVSSGAITVPVQIYQAEKLFSDSNTHSLLQGLFYGTLLILAIYNGLLFLLTRSRAYLYYALYMLSLSLFMLSVSGLSFQYLWPQNPKLANLAIPVSEGLVVLTISLFARSFLYTSSSQTRTLRAINCITALGVFIVAIGLLAPYYFAIKAGTLLSVASLFMVYVIGIVRMAEHYRPAKLFVIAWTIFLAGALTYALASFGFIPGQFVQEYIIRIATGAQVIFINIALASRVQVLNEQLINAETKAKNSLESQVSERTKQLHQAMKKLAQLNNTLKAMSTTDELTGIANRRFFNDSLEEQVKLARREKKPLSLLLIDIDHFKVVNDRHGHLAGDECLKMLTNVFTRCLKRPGDLLARFGGEEFSVILPNTTSQGAVMIATQILKAVQHSPFNTAGHELPMTVSIGVATRIAEIDGLSLIRDADEALYRAKDNGRNTIELGTANEKNANINIQSANRFV